MPWREITTSNVLKHFTPAEQATLNNIMGGVDDLSDKITDAIGAVRGFVAAGGNPLDGASLTTIPDQLRSHTIAVVVWGWLSSFPALKVFKTDARREANDAAEKMFALVGSQDPKRPRIEQPTVILNQTAPVGGVATVRKGDHVHRRGFGRMGSS